MRDYTNKTIYLGMDVHKESYSVTAICDGVVVKTDKLSADPTQLVKYLNRFFPGAIIKSAYEAGFCGFGLHRLLIEHHIDNIVINPASIEVKMNDKVKTDKRDSLKIAVQLSKGSLNSIYVPSQHQQGLRVAPRYRATVVKQRAQCVNRIKGHLHFIGYSLGKAKLSKKTCKRLKEMNFPDEDKFQIHLLLDEWERYGEIIKACEKQMEAQGDGELEKYYRSVPGIGLTITKTLSTELGDMSQFPNERSLFSYCGLTPTEYSSGDKIRRGNISRQGKSVLRMLLTQASWRAVKIDPALNEVFENLARRAGKKRAIQAIARKLIGRIRSCIRKKEIYELNKTI